MDTSYSNSCSIIYNREILKNSTSCNQLISDRLSRKNDLLFKRDLIAHYGCVNAVEFSSNGQYLVSGGDDRRVLLWNVQKALHNCGKPTVMRSEHHSNIFCLSFDNSVTHILSAGNDDQVILHDMETCKVCDVFNLEHPVYGISVDPCNDNIFASAGEDGRILIFDTRLTSSDAYKLASFKSPFHAVMFNPVDPRLLTTANSKEGAALWDVRVSNKVLLQYGRRGSCMNVRWDQTGTRILALRRRQIPILYEINNSKPIAQFFHENYYNSCTMKSCCFAGLKDEFVLSGSDDFNLYMWKISDAMKNEDAKSNAHLVLKGHRSIVNQVRFDPYNCVIASSGVEKLIKIWSPMPLPDGTQNTSDWIRKRYTHDEYLSLLLRSGTFMSHDYSEQSTTEDPQMMAFFDSLVQRERDGLASESDDDSSETSLYTSIECFEDTDYSSQSEDLNVPTTRAVVHTISLDVNNENSVSSSEETLNTEEENSESAENVENTSRRRKSKSSSAHHLGLYFRANENEDQSTLSSSSSSSSSSSLSSSSSSSSSSSCSSSSTPPVSKNDLQSSSKSEEVTNTNILPRKRKSKSSVKEALQRLKRVRPEALQSLPSQPVDRVASDRSGSSSGLEVSASNGGTSTDTLDSGVYVYSSPPRPKYKFTLFKKNQKRKYRTLQPSYSSSSSSDSE